MATAQYDITYRQDDGLIVRVALRDDAWLACVELPLATLQDVPLTAAKALECQQGKWRVDGGKLVKAVLPVFDAAPPIEDKP